jgi:hypothetical protein
VNIRVNSVNDAPSFVAGSDVAVQEDSGEQTVAGWATQILLGPANEASQTPTFQVTASDPALFAVAPAISSDGTLTFSPAANASGTTNVTVVLVDGGGTANGGQESSAAQSFDITITPVNDAPTHTAVADQNAEGLQTVQIALAATDPDPGDTRTYSLVSGPSGASVTPSGQFSWTAPDVLAAESFNVVVRVADAQGAFDDEDFTITVNPNYLNVVGNGLTLTDTGFHVRFDRPFDAAKLNLYGSALVGEGPADVTLVDASAANVFGSLAVDDDNQGFTFVKTGGVLNPGDYTIKLFSRADGLVDDHGRPLDGNPGDEVTGDYSFTFTVEPSSAPVLSIGDFARGPGQRVNLPANNNNAGIPVRILNGQGAGSVSFGIRYDPALLTIEDVVLDGALTGSVEFALEEELVQISVTDLQGVQSNAATALVRLIGRVPANAPYTSKHLLDIVDVAINGDITGSDDDGLQLVAFMGDVSGNGRYNASDLTLMQRVLVGLDSGFSAFALADPNLVGDVNGGLVFNASDRTLLNREILSVFDETLDVPVIPPIDVLVTVPADGPDPLVSMPKDLTAQPGQLVSVPIRLDTSAGVRAAEMHIAYDSSALEAVAVRRGGLTQSFDGPARVKSPGLIVVDIASIEPLDGGAGHLIEIDFRVNPNAPAGMQLIDLQWVELNEGGLTLNPAPRAGMDPTDGTLHIRQPLSSVVTVSKPPLAPAALPPMVGIENDETGGHLSATELPVIDWSKRASPAATFAHAFKHSSAAAKDVWVASFVSRLAQTDDDSNPNAKLRVKPTLLERAAARLSRLVR